MKIWFIIIVLLAISCSQDKPSFEAPTIYYNNVPVMYEKSSQTDYTAVQNRLGAGIGIFYWNELSWNDFSPNMKFFALFHEICHLNIPTEDESMADCCALRLMNASCMLSDEEIIEIFDFFSGDNSIERQIELLSCFEKIKHPETI